MPASPTQQPAAEAAAQNPAPRSSALGSAALIATALVVAAGTLGLSDLIVAPARAGYAGHGQTFQAMSAAPFDFVGTFPQRILWPLLAHVVGLGGERAWVFAHLVSGLLLTTVFWFCRRRGATPLDATLITTAIALTGAVQAYKPLACSSDPLSFTLLLLALYWAHRPGVHWALLLLSAFSHEMVFFFAPLLAYYRCFAIAPAHRGTWWREGLAWAAIAAIYQGWRMVVRANATGMKYDAGAYLAENFWFPWGLPTVGMLLVMMMLVEFGPLLAIVVWGWRTGWLGGGDKHRSAHHGGAPSPGESPAGPAGALGRWGPWLFALAVAIIIALAYDVMRFANYAFLPLVLSAVPMLQQRGGRLWFVAFTVAAVGLRAWLYQGTPLAGGWPLATVSRTGIEILGTHPDLALIVGSAKSLAGRMNSAVIQTWLEFQKLILQELWPGALAVVGGTLACVALGLWLARRSRSAANA